MGVDYLERQHQKSNWPFLFTKMFCYNAYNSRTGFHFAKTNRSPDKQWVILQLNVEKEAKMQPKTRINNFHRKLYEPTDVTQQIAFMWK